MMIVALRLKSVTPTPGTAGGVAYGKSSSESRQQQSSDETAGCRQDSLPRDNWIARPTGWSEAWLPSTITHFDTSRGSFDIAKDHIIAQLLRMISIPRDTNFSEVWLGDRFLQFASGRHRAKCATGQIP